MTTFAPARREENYHVAAQELAIPKTAGRVQAILVLNRIAYRQTGSHIAFSDLDADIFVTEGSH